MMQNSFIALLCVLLGVNLLFAQAYDVKYIGTPEGLSQGMVTGMCQDKDGFLWVGTLSGLNRYDGYKFKTYTHSAGDAYSLSNNLITGIVEDSKGRLWIGTKDGINCYDRLTGKFYRLNPVYNAQNKKVENLVPVLEAANGHIWLEGSLAAIELIVPDDFPINLQSKDNVAYNTFEAGRGLPAVNLFDLHLYQRHNGQVSMILPDGLCFTYQAKNSAWKETPPMPTTSYNLNDYPGEVVYDAYRKGYWTLTSQTLQLMSNGKINQNLSLPQLSIPISTNFISGRTLYIDPQGALWFLADLHNMKLLYKILPNDITGGQGVKVEPLFQDKGNAIGFKELLTDKQGNIWLGTTGYGIIQIMPQPNYFTNYFQHKSLGALSPTPNKGAFWARSSAYMHLFQLSGNRAEVEALQTVQHSTGAVYPVNHKLVISNGALVSRYSLNNDECYLQIESPNGKKHYHKIPKNYHFDPIIEDRQNRIWLTGSYGNIACMIPPYDSVITYSYQSVLQNNESEIAIKQLYQSQNGVFWLATQHGLLQMEAPVNKTPQFKLLQNNPTNPKSLSSNAIFAVLDDPAQPDRYLWVATNGNGLNKMDKQTGYCQHYTKQNGLPDNVVYGILADTLGRLWLSTNFGISCFNPHTQYFLNFTANDGLPNNEFNNQSFYQDTQGNLYFGSVKGLTVFNPQAILPSENFAPVFFTELKINNQITEPRDSLNILQQPVEFAKQIYLKYNQNFITIVYAALDFASKDKTKFYYKMDGVDNDWVFANNRTELSYPNLPPGTYTLHVSNINQNGEKNPQIASLTFVIAPPWWQSWAAYVFYALLLASMIFGAFRFQANRIKLENELLFKQKEAQNLQDLDELKTRFFTNITHEFRTPLTIVIEPLRQLLQQPDNQHLKPQLQLIYNNANKLLLLVNQLLDLSKVEFGNLQTNWAEGDLILVLREIFDYFLPIAQKKQQTLLWQSNLPELYGITDRQMLEKITYNLLSNAHKFTPEGGSIALSIGQPNPHEWTLTVQDTGIGIEPHQLPYIFDRFYQTDNSLTRRSEGTGIGLALVKELCALLGAKYKVNSMPRKGTTFTLTFPIRPENATTVETMNTETANYTKTIPIQTQPNLTATANYNETDATTILLVEDNADMRLYLNMVLTQKGYAVSEAENGKLGLDTALQIMPDLIITDVMMPEMDGYQLTQALKTNPITSHIPIIILTAKGRTESKIEGYRLGADAYLPKPFSTEELLVRIEQIINTRRVLQQKYAQTVLLPDNYYQTNQSSTPELDTNNLLSDIDRQWLYDLNNAINQNLADEHFVVDSLLPLFTMNRTQFYAKVKALTGQTPARMLRNARLDKAYHLLASQPDMNLKEVTMQVGLNDTKNFALIFKDRFGATPQQLQKK